MKKAILTVGLFSMMMVLTSFTGKISIEKSKIENINQLNHKDSKGGQQLPKGGKLDYNENTQSKFLYLTEIYETKGGQQFPAPGKLD